MDEDSASPEEELDDRSSLRLWGDLVFKNGVHRGEIAGHFMKDEGCTYIYLERAIGSWDAHSVYMYPNAVWNWLENFIPIEVKPS